MDNSLHSCVLCKLIEFRVAHNIHIAGIIIILAVRLQVGVVVRGVAMLQEAHLQLLLTCCLAQLGLGIRGCSWGAVGLALLLAARLGA